MGVRYTLAATGTGFLFLHSVNYSSGIKMEPLAQHQGLEPLTRLSSPMQA